MKLFVATQNPGKLKEFHEMLSQIDCDVLTPKDYPKIQDLEVEETGKTFSENAFLKAQAFGEKTQILSLADDSGLEVASLDGFPGVLSDRWHPGSSEEKNRALLERMRTEKHRTAQFTSCLCLYDPKTLDKYFFEGKILGKISEQQKGHDGFGYDPIFIPQGSTQTFAEMGTHAKNALSHRKKALEKLVHFLKNRIS